MGKSLPRAVEKGITPNPSSSSSSVVPQAPVFHPTEAEFRDPLLYISQIRPMAEPFGLCLIVPPESWSPPFSLDLSSFSFPTKSQPIHRLQSRPPSCDPDTFRLDYARFLGRRGDLKRRGNVVFDGAPLDLCRLFHAVKRFGGYDSVSNAKRWGDVSLLVRPGKNRKISECSKHVLSQLYWEHLYDYEAYIKNMPARKRRKKRSHRLHKAVDVINEEELDQICEQCKSGLHGDVMLLCDRCDRGWHLYCLSPPLDSVPAGNWYCLECVNSDKDSFGFVPRKSCSLELFRRMDERARRKWFGQKRATRVQIEKQFWEIVEGRAGEVEVMYGSDLDTSVFGSGFPHLDKSVPSSVDSKVWREYCDSPWNLNNLPKLPGSMLRAVKENIAGVMVPWLYVGMLFSSFCWHVEDHCFYSMNYLHWGEPKCWYGVPGSEANAFEQVMRNALPDLFDAQPDLLFQLVTMLNPSVFQEHGVPVYNLLQEPGNFVITFPRSFHCGFNFGLNCAEAVNFAPADWLPHGGVGAELYRQYHKAPVLSHEELLLVVAKNGCDAKALPYLKGEMHRIFTREERCREELWLNGIVRSSLMSPKKHPDDVGSEEDPTCIICLQYLYLSAITCCCRPSAYVCLEHWKRLCECSPNNLHLLYRHNLAELGDLVCISSLTAEAKFSEVATKIEFSQWRHLLPNESGAKVKGGRISYAQLAEDWLSKSYQILEMPFSDAAYNTALKEAEQFLWANHEMDPVRDMSYRLIKTQKWASNVKNCLSKIDDCIHSKNKHTAKVSCYEVEELLSVNPVPCCEPGLTKLKAHVEEASKLVSEIKSALSSCLCIDKLEELYSRAAEFPINLRETEILANELSSAKIWLKNASACLSEKKPDVLEISVLSTLTSEMLQLHVHLPEMHLLSNLCREADSWKIRCEEYLKRPHRLKELEDFLRDAAILTFRIPELNLLRQYHRDACSWICHANDLVQNIEGREDYTNIVKELYSVLNDGESLRLQVDEVPLVKEELKKSICRKKALEARSTRMPLETIQQVVTEASLLKINEELLFIEMSRVLKAAISWEEKARVIFGHASYMSEFETLIRSSEEIFATLPSLVNIVDAVSVTQSWMHKSQPYLEHNLCGRRRTGLFLKVDDLKELIAQSKCLKVILDIPQRLEIILKELHGWEHDALSLLEDSKCLLHMHDAGVLIDTCLPNKIEELLGKVNVAIEVALSLGFEFEELPKLRDTSLMLKWISRALSFWFRVPLLMEVDSLLEEVDHLPAELTASNLARKLFGGTSWLKNALILIPDPQICKRCKLEDLDNALGENQEIVIMYPMVVSILLNAIEKHKSWIEQCHSFFALPGQQSWAFLSKLKESGQADALDCLEMEKIILEVEKIDKWKLRCHDLMQSSVGDIGALSIELVKIKRSLDKALCIYAGSRACMTRTFGVCCPNDLDDEKVYTCLTCEDRYHFSCGEPPLAIAGEANEYVCSFCLYVESGDASLNGIQTSICSGNRPEFNSFIELLSVADGFCTRIEELDLVEEIVKQAQKCKSYLTQIVDCAISYHGKDLGIISESLFLALKAMAIAGVYDKQDSCNLESALTRNSWKIRIKKLLKGSRKPNIQQIQHLEKEGSALGIPSEDHFMVEITKVRQICLRWLENVKKAISDSGELALSKVYELISEGEDLPCLFGKELKLLRARSILYCICRKPYDQRAMIACDQCDEWYHFDCINLYESAPKTFFCPACHPVNGELISLPSSASLEERLRTDEEPRTPPACYNESSSDESKRKQLKDIIPTSQKKVQVRIDLVELLRCYGEIDILWRENKRPLQRTARRRKFEGIS
ncbi:lysine-specific demethylase JMJ17 [Typha latifolia]|uniref:lysine-specific demethylase JMJ17 n=1 Tax=Typha latifolia TaxID=4733 RepID=UPI003C2E8AB0